MKKALFCIAAFTLILAACSDGDNDEPGGGNGNNNPPTITIDSSILSNGVLFNAKGGEKSITITTTGADWTLSVAQTTGGSTWCTASATSGKEGIATVKFTATENSDYDDRSVAVTIKAGTVSKTITVTQKSAEGLLVTANKFEVEQAGGTIDVEVKANITYQLEVAETAKEWITASTTRALTAKTHTFNIAASEELEKREGEIYIKSGDKMETVKVYQAGGAILVLTKNEYAVGSEGETITIDVKSNFDYEIQMPDVDWILDEAATRGASSHSLKYIVEPNESYESRSDEIVFYDKNSDLKETVKVVQAQKDAIILSEKEYTLEASGESIEVKLNSNVEFEVQIPAYATWITQASTRGLTEQSVYLKVAEYTKSGSRRCATVTFINKESNLSEAVTIIQLGPTPVVTLPKAGWLETLLGDSYETIESLKIIGPVNSDDVKFIRKMLTSYELKVLDLSEASIVEDATLTAIAISDSYFEVNIRKDAIGEYMFHGCNGLTSIVLPSNVTAIRWGAFYNCSSLTSITIPNNVTAIGRSAFYNCSSLTSITIPNNVTTIEDRTFYGCTSLASITIPNSVTTIEEKTFYDCSSLTNITIPNNVTTIGYDAFYRCSSLTSITIPNSVKTIGKAAFYKCTSLASITIPGSKTYIGKEAFYGCTSLASITIENGAGIDSNDVFTGCSSLTSVTINGTSIARYAFYGCSSLTNVTIGNNVTSIKKSAFYNCSSLTNISIPSSVTSIEASAFEYCPFSTIYCHATTPPILGSNSFKQTATCKLYVPKGCKEAYIASSWSDYFYEIIEM